MASLIRDRGLSPSVVLFSSLFAAQSAILVLSPILPQVAAEFGVTTSTAAQLRAVSGVTAGLVALLVAARGGRFPLVRLLNGGLALLAIGALGSAVAPTFVVLLLAQVPVGLGLALVLSGGLAAADAWSEPGEGAKTLSWALVGQPAGGVDSRPAGRGGRGIGGLALDLGGGPPGFGNRGNGCRGNTSSQRQWRT